MGLHKRLSFGLFTSVAHHTRAIFISISTLKFNQICAFIHLAIISGIIMYMYFFLFPPHRSSEEKTSTTDFPTFPPAAWRHSRRCANQNSRSCAERGRSALKMAERGVGKRITIEYNHEDSDTAGGCCLSTINNSLPELGRWWVAKGGHRSFVYRESIS